MANPLHLLSFRARRLAARRRRPVPVPTALPETDAIFLVMRRMRAPFLVVIATFSFCTAGLTFMPGTDGQGRPYTLTIFDALYQMTMTVTTVGYTEAPYSYSYPQRMWVTMSILLLVVSWAYAIGVFFSLLQDPAFTDAVAAQRFRRRVRKLREPFMIIAGYGQAGRAVGHELDEQRRRFVVVDNKQSHIETVATEQLLADVPAVEGDCRTPAMLGVAGLDRPNCEAVLALTDDDEANLAVVMAVSVLRPDVPVLARCTDRAVQQAIDNFQPASVINPDDRYGNYLALAVHRPVTHQVLTWLMDNDEHKLPAVRGDLGHGTWIVCGEGAFADEVAVDLERSGIHVERVDPADGLPDVTHATGFVAASENDITNIALVEQARICNPDVYTCARQKTNANKEILTGLETDSVYIATELVAREVLARVLTPIFWRFIEQILEQDEEWVTRLRDRLVERVRWRTPERELVALTHAAAPAVGEWLDRGRSLTLADLLRRPDDRDAVLPVVVLMLLRGEETVLVPDETTELRLDDQLLVVGKPEGLGRLPQTLLYTDALEYVCTGRQVPSTWLWRRLTAARRQAGEMSSGA